MPRLKAPACETLAYEIELIERAIANRHRTAEGLRRVLRHRELRRAGPDGATLAPMGWSHRASWAVGWMMTLYSLMGTRRREQIQAVLADWRKTPNPPGKRARVWNAVARRTTGLRPLPSLPKGLVLLSLSENMHFGPPPERTEATRRRTASHGR